ncbi:MAG: replicative DNA helicase [Oscillospiraceae bacterium]|jgi:replicative DNA helicase|nr:replicative DNA helicase [Oscillospiraceae bacterium]
MDTLQSLSLPHDTTAEQAVIGSILMHGASIADVLDVLRPDDFYSETNREIFTVILSMFNYGQPIDAVTLIDEMRKQGVAKTNTPEYFTQLLSVTPTWRNVMTYAKIVSDKARVRAIAEAAGEISAKIAEGEGGAEEMLEFAERKIYALRQGRGAGGLTPVSDIILNVYDQLRELADSGSSISGLATGMSRLDNVIMGLNSSDLILLASRPGVGKTSLALNVLVNVAKHEPEKVAAYFSLEMSKEQLVSRILSGEAFIDSKKLRTGRLNADDWRRLGSAASILSKTGIRIDDNSMISVAEINSQCRRIDNLALVVIDYLQLMNSQGSENRLQAVSEMSRMMKLMAMELKVPVICCCQLSRASVQRENKRPVLSDLRESGSLEQDADIVLGLYREDAFKQDAEEHNSAELIVLKNRHGETTSVKLQWLPEYTTYTEVEERYD